MKKNIPYVKQFDSNGECINPITAENPYLHEFATVSSQEKDLFKDRFIGNTKKNSRLDRHVNLTVLGKFRFKRFRQHIIYVNKKTKEVQEKYIDHMLNV